MAGMRNSYSLIWIYRLFDGSQKLPTYRPEKPGKRRLQTLLLTSHHYPEYNKQGCITNIRAMCLSLLAQVDMGRNCLREFSRQFQLLTCCCTGGPVGKFQNIEGTYLGSDLVQYANARGFVVPFPVEQVALCSSIFASS